MTVAMAAENFMGMPPIPRKVTTGAGLDVYATSYTASTPNGQKSKHTLQPTVLDPLDKLPINLKWEKLARSRFVEDETVLRHIPYVGDEEGEFINDLYENYDSSMVFDEAQEREDKINHDVIKAIVLTCMRDMPDVARREQPKKSTTSKGGTGGGAVWGGSDDDDAVEEEEAGVGFGIRELRGFSILGTGAKKRRKSSRKRRNQKQNCSLKQFNHALQLQ